MVVEAGSIFTVRLLQGMIGFARLVPRRCVCLSCGDAGATDRYLAVEKSIQGISMAPFLPGPPHRIANPSVNRETYQLPPFPKSERGKKLVRQLDRQRPRIRGALI